MYKFILILFLIVNCASCSQDILREPTNDILMEAIPLPHVPVSPHHRMPDEAAPPTFVKIRNDITEMWLKDLLKAQSSWFFVGHVADCLAQLCAVTTPIASAMSIGFNNKDLSLIAMVTGVVSVGLNRLGHYAERESYQRGSAANRILIAEGVPPIIVINDSSSNHGSNL